MDAFTVIKALAAKYSVAELTAKRDAAVDALAKGGVVTQVSTGLGTGYTKTLTLSPTEAVELWQSALDYKESGTLPSCGTVQEFINYGVTVC